MKLLRLLLPLALACSPAAAAQEPDYDPAAALIPAFADATQPDRLQTLLRLQLAARRYQAAEATIDRLAALYRPTEPYRADALHLWRIYARARRHEETGLSKPDALARAFAELFASLSDRDMADVLPWVVPNIDRLRENQTRAAQACQGQAVDRCPAAAELIAARQALAARTYLHPDLQPLIRADVERRFHVEELLIPTPDGARIDTLLVRPRNAAAPLTSLLNFSIYVREDWRLSDVVKMAAHGYAAAYAYSRGRGRSPGPTTPYVHDGPDAAAVIEWLAAQSWSDGRVGMFSGSYNASTQWAAAKHRPRPLRALATSASNAPGVDSPMQGNVFQNFIYPWPLYTTDTRGLDEVNYGDSARWSALQRTWYLSGRPYRDLERIDGHPNPIFRTWLDHPSYDAFWQRLAPYREEFARIDIPVFVQTGYFDGGIVGARYYMQEHYRHRPGADHRILIGPYHHFAMQSGVLPSIGGYDMDRAAMIDLQAIRLQWFDYALRGGPLPDLLRDRVNFQVVGANVWRHVPNVDAMATGRMRLHLTGERDGTGYRFGEARRPRSELPELRVDFADRTNLDRPVPDGMLDTHSHLLFRTAPFAQPTEVAGAFRGRLEIVTNKRDLDLSILFFQESADGTYRPLGSYIGRASYMADRTRRQLLRPGVRQTLAFESWMVMGHRLAAGSRIVALVGVPKQPEFQINYGTGGDVSRESIADAGEPLRISFQRGSYLELGTRR